MKFFFLAKQNQHNRIARLLTEAFGKPRLTPYNGSRGQGVMISLVLPTGVSKRQVGRFLYSSNVPGSVSCRNKLRIIRAERWDHYSIAAKVGYYEPFIWIDSDEKNPKMQKAWIVNEMPYCSCCGPNTSLELIE